MSRQRFYHGGPRGLARILPASITGARSTSDLTGSFGIHDPSRVYVTTDFTSAILYAACHEKGVVYEVEADDLQPDPDCSEPGISYSCGSCRIVRAHKVGGKVLLRARKALLA